MMLLIMLLIILLHDVGGVAQLLILLCNNGFVLFRKSVKRQRKVRQTSFLCRLLVVLCKSVH